MRRSQGYAVWMRDGKITKERDTVTCGHCMLVSEIPPGVEPGDMCKMCMRYLCQRCMARLLAGFGCEHFEKKLEARERRDALLRRAS